jgi:hypothetical protein
MKNAHEAWQSFNAISLRREKNIDFNGLWIFFKSKSCEKVVLLWKKIQSAKTVVVVFKNYNELPTTLNDFICVFSIKMYFFNNCFIT